jgi:hypothetical protein
MKISRLVMITILVLALLSLAMSIAWAQEEPTVPTIEPTPPPVIPEASSLVLFGSAATGVAAYVGLQIRARRGRKR